MSLCRKFELGISNLELIDILAHALYSRVLQGDRKLLVEVILTLKSLSLDLNENDKDDLWNSFPFDMRVFLSMRGWI